MTDNYRIPRWDDPRPSDPERTNRATEHLQPDWIDTTPVARQDRQADARHLRPVDDPDPYPERLTRDPGVRQHNHPSPVPDRMVTTDHWPSGHLPFAAKQPAAEPRPRQRRFPWASTGLYVLGHIALALAIGRGDLQPHTGIAYTFLWLLCGLLLIASQMIGEHNAGDRR
jgi:hypothetical protein